MPSGGKRANAGRKPGSKNKDTIARGKAMQEMSEALSAFLGPDTFPGDAHALLTAIYKSPMASPELRVKCAGLAIRYEKPALASIEATGKDGGPISIETRDMTPTESARRIAFVLARATQKNTDKD